LGDSFLPPLRSSSSPFGLWYLQ